MNVIKCMEGHYYDGDKYAQCPHCGKAGVKPAVTVKKTDTVDKNVTLKVAKEKTEERPLKMAVKEALLQKGRWSF